MESELLERYPLVLPLQRLNWWDKMLLLAKPFFTPTYLLNNEKLLKCSDKNFNLHITLGSIPKVRK